ncbi:MAG TPA: hypothetical protein VEN81_13315, partial [Planctomycetota bacterium]|nr:hypothetical protein [Planctomycetota bacterium]
SCEPPRTRIAVEEGRVRLRRLADGASTEVARGETATATLESSVPLESRAALPLPLSWRETFEHPPVGAWKGEWQGQDSQGPSRLRNVLDVSYRRRDGTVVPAYVVSLGNPSQPLCRVRPESVLRLRYRLERPHGLIILVSVQHPEGRFAGNFQVDLGPDAAPSDPDGWKTFRAPLSSLSGRFPEGIRFPPAGRLTLLFVACYSPEARLEVAEAALE